MAVDASWPLLNALTVQQRVIGALVLRDLRTRFGRTIFGAIIIVAWPLSHLITLTIVYSFVRKLIPIGTDVTVFIATGVIPYILCLYPSRMIMLSLQSNKQLLAFPIIKSVDIIAARAVVEIVAAFWVVAIYLLMLTLLDFPVWPQRPEDAVAAVLATIYLAFALGMLSALMYALMRVWIGVHILIVILMYISSGLFFVPSSLPQRLQDVLWFNPMLHAVEWLRSAYYDGYGYGLLDKGYLLGFATAVLFIAMLLERLVRGRYLQT
ncbi:MAG TPA: ABC transporter permease [Xanthobacteraceae bacterium]|nr:ABC transporter permease [Xanthobacteraceae bacterium]